MANTLDNEQLGAEMDSDTSDSTDSTDSSDSRQWGGVRPGSGRKRIPDDLKLKLRNLRLNDHDWSKLMVLGGSKWVRERIHHARLTSDQESELAQRKAGFALSPGSENNEASDQNQLSATSTAALAQQLADVRRQLDELINAKK